MPSIVDILGSTLVGNDGNKVETSSLSEEGTIVGLFFSAHWCPPCRGFTPKLAEFYKRYKQLGTGSGMEIVFISSDKDDSSFQEYFSEMPWLALPYEDRDRKARLSKKFKVQGIPALIFVEGKTGKLITSEGRNNVLDDPHGEHFPWYPKALSELMKGPLVSQMGERDSEQALKGKVKGLYFSAHWCPPCRGFTPSLIDVYKKLLNQSQNFEVVFVSSDRSEESFEDYFSTMPWLAIPYGDARTTELTKYFGVQGIPTLILLDEDNEIITTNGRLVISKDPEGKEFPWPPQPLNELNDITAPCLNEGACLLFLTDGEEEHIDQAKSLLTEVAKPYIDQYNATKNTDNELPELSFLYEGMESDDMAESLRSIGDLEDQTPLVVIFDIPEQQLYIHPEKEITKDGLQSLVTSYKDNQLQYKPLRR